MRRTLIAAVLTALPAWAHSEGPLKPHDLWSAWTFDPAVLVPVMLTAVLYAIGARSRRGASGIQMVCFWSGWSFLALALLSPVHPLGEVLFAAHMSQHEILMLLAAPLLVLSRPLAPMLWGMPFSWRRSLGRLSKGVQPVWATITLPVNAFVIHAVALWVWHVPALFEATLRNDFIHAMQHLSFFASALLFWWSLLYANGRAGYGAAILYIFGTAIHTSILGALLTFSTTIWYHAYETTAPEWGMTALEDQQLGGLIMWVPAGLVYIVAGIGVLLPLLRETPERHTGLSPARSRYAD